MQHPTLWNPGLHLGYHMSPFFSHPWLFSLLHFSSCQMAYPHPLPQALGFKQYNPLSVNPSGHWLAHSQHPKLVNPSLHLGQYTYPHSSHPWAFWASHFFLEGPQQKRALHSLMSLMAPFTKGIPSWMAVLIKSSYCWVDTSVQMSFPSLINPLISSIPSLIQLIVL